MLVCMLCIPFLLYWLFVPLDERNASSSMHSTSDKEADLNLNISGVQQTETENGKFQLFLATIRYSLMCRIKGWKTREVFACVFFLCSSEGMYNYLNFNKVVQWTNFSNKLFLPAAHNTLGIMNNNKKTLSTPVRSSLQSLVVIYRFIWKHYHPLLGRKII